MLLVPDEITSRLDPGLRNRRNLLREPRVAHRLLNIMLQRHGLWARTEELAIRIYRSGKCLREPVEGDAV